MSQARNRYEEFHGHSVRFRKSFRFHQPEELVILGRAVAIEYECDKLNGGGDGKLAVYRHEFETESYVCEDEKGKRQLYILGPSITITDAGIEN